VGEVDARAEWLDDPILLFPFQLAWKALPSFCPDTVVPNRADRARQGVFDGIQATAGFLGPPLRQWGVFRLQGR
jgi:hypothetical protein